MVGEHLACAAAAALQLNIAPPALAWDPELRWPGLYQHGTVTLRPDAPCHVVRHEVFHHYQAIRLPPLRNEREYWRREMDAKGFEQ